MGDLATRHHWDEEWARAAAPVPFGTYWPDRALSRFMASDVHPRAGQHLIEIGAGNSRYLPGLAMRFNLHVAGLDYSLVGLRMARRNLEAAGVEGELVHGDLFDPPAGWQGRFDIALTMGVVEHFEDTRHVVGACARYLAPGGRMLTVIPNLQGINGVAARWLNRDLYDKHRPLDHEQLAHAHAEAGLAVRHAGYLIGVDGWVINPNATKRRWKRWAWKPALVLTRVAWLADEFIGLPRSSLLSAWVVVVADVPAK